MAKKPTRSSRREFLRDAALTAGAVGAASLLPAGLPGGAGRAQAQEAKIGAQLIGKLEGPELVLDSLDGDKPQAPGRRIRYSAYGIVEVSDLTQAHCDSPLSC